VVEEKVSAVTSFYLYRSKKDYLNKKQFLEKHICDWNFATPLKIELKPYRNPRTISQNALFHKWCDEISNKFIKQVDNASPENIKVYLKHMFLGTESLVLGKTEIKDQVKQSSKLDVGEMLHFMDQIYHWSLDHGIILTVPEDSDYQKHKASQND